MSALVSERLRLLAALAERTEQGCPDLTRDGCDCTRCQFWRPVVAALDMVEPPADAGGGRDA